MTRDSRTDEIRYQITILRGIDLDLARRRIADLALREQERA